MKFFHCVSSLRLFQNDLSQNKIYKSFHCQLKETHRTLVGARRLADELRYAPEDEALVMAVVGDTVVVDGVTKALELRAHVSDVPMVTRDGTVFHADGPRLGRNGRTAAAHMLDVHHGGAGGLGDEVARLEALVAERLAFHQSLRRESARRRRPRAGAARGAPERARARPRREGSTAEAEGGQHEERLAHLAAGIEELRGQMAEADGERDAAQATLDQAREDCAGVDAKIAEAETNAADWREQVKAQQSMLMEAQGRAGAREKLSAAKSTLARLAKSEEELTERAQRLETELCDGAAEIGITAATLVQAQGAARQRSGGGEGRAPRRRRRRAARSTASAPDLGEREAGLEGFSAPAPTRRRPRSRSTSSPSASVSSAMEAPLLAGVREKFRGPRAGLSRGGTSISVAARSESRARIAELSGLINRMGAVNLDAMWEHEEAEKRYAFYTTQKADLDKALSDLERAIQQMNRESRSSSPTPSRP